MPSSENFDPSRVASARRTLFGIRMRLRDEDPFRNVVGDDWETVRWYSSAEERDRALADLRRQHEYSRVGDRPTLVYETTESEKPADPFR